MRARERARDQPKFGQLGPKIHCRSCAAVSHSLGNLADEQLRVMVLNTTVPTVLLAAPNYTTVLLPLIDYEIGRDVLGATPVRQNTLPRSDGYAK